MLETLQAGLPLTASSAAARPRTDAGISIGELRAKKVAIDWSEAIAIVQALCRTLCGPGGPVEAIRVDTHNVFIHADGTVSVVPSTRLDGVTVLEQLRHVLCEILPEEGIRQPLRAVLFDPPAGSSVEDWSKSIEYYERRNRSVHIRAVYERAVNAAVRMTSETPLSVGRSRVSDTPAQRLLANAPDLVTRHLFAVTGLAILAIAAVAGTIAWMVDARLLGTPSSYESGAPVSARLATPQRRPPSVAMAPVPEMAIVTSEGAPAESLASDAASSAIVEDEVRGVQPVSIIYSQEDADVVPAVPIIPRLASAIPTGIDADKFAEFEVLVTEAGGVESVKARRVPGTMTDALSMTMSLSAVKAWRFSPALKDGAPVRYRKIVWVLKG